MLKGSKRGRRSTALPPCSAPRARRGRACDGPAFRHAGRWRGPTTAAERLALPTPYPHCFPGDDLSPPGEESCARVRDCVIAEAANCASAAMGRRAGVAVRLSQATPQNDLHSGRWERGGRLSYDRSEPGTCLGSWLGAQQCLRTGRHVRKQRRRAHAATLPASHRTVRRGRARPFQQGAPQPASRSSSRASTASCRHGASRPAPFSKAFASRATPPSKLPGRCVALIAGRARPAPAASQASLQRFPDSFVRR